MNFNDKKKKLLSLREVIMRMPSNMNKVNMIDGYAGLLSYYKEVCGLTLEETKEYDIDEEFLSKYDKRITKSTQNKIDEVSNVAPTLYQKYEDIINEYKRNGFCSYEFSLFKRVNPEKLYKIVADFFKFLGPDVAKLYNQIITNNNIFLLDDCDYSGVSMNALSVDNPCIIIRNAENYLSYYFTLVHEMGHCYQFYLQRNHKHIESFNVFCEVTSLLFEKLFLAFLDNEKKLKKIMFNSDINNHLYFLNDLSVSKVLCELFMTNDIKNIDAQDLTYQSSTPKKELERRMSLDCGCILSNKKDFDLTAFHYSIGEVIANYFFNKMQSDFDSGWKEFKDFICTVDNYPLKEVLDKYMDIDSYKEKINTFTKSYHSR